MLGFYCHNTSRRRLLLFELVQFGLVVVEGLELLARQLKGVLRDANQIHRSRREIGPLFLGRRFDLRLSIYFSMKSLSLNSQRSSQSFACCSIAIIDQSKKTEPRADLHGNSSSLLRYFSLSRPNTPPAEKTLDEGLTSGFRHFVFGLVSHYVLFRLNATSVSACISLADSMIEGRIEMPTRCLQVSSACSSARHSQEIGGPFSMVALVADENVSILE